MNSGESARSRLPKGVTALQRPRGGRGYRASIRKGKGIEVHLGLYETPWLAAFAHATAAQLLGRGAPPVEAPRGQEPTADEVRAITARVRRRLGRPAEPSARRAVETPPSTEALLTFFEIAAVGFWRAQAAADDSDHPATGLDAAAGRLVEAASLLFWSRSAGHPEPLDALTERLAQRLDQTFRRPELTRAVLDDDGDDPWRVARWLVYPEVFPGHRARGFREEILHLYADLLDGDLERSDGPPPTWAVILGLTPPFDADHVRAAYRARSRSAHPDAGGHPAAFVRLRAAYEEAMAYLATREA